MNTFLKKLFNQILGGFKKYPLLSVLIVISTLLGFILTYNTVNDLNSFYYWILKLFLSTHLIIPTILAVTLTKDYLNKRKGLYISVLATTIIALLTYTLIIFPWNFETYTNLLGYNALVYKYLVVFALSISSVFILPYINKHKEKNFINLSLWGHVLQVTNGFIAAMLYGIVSQIGLSLALGAVDVLWNVEVNEWLYGAIAVFSFNFISYLRLTNSIDSITKTVNKVKLNKVLEIFAKYILLPLTAIYTVILYPYIIKIIASGEWPNNMITGLSLAFIAFVYTTVYLLFFDKKSKQSKIQLSKLLPALSIPIILMQIYGLWIRIDAYGFTMNRSMLLLFAITSFILSLYFTFNKRVKLISIPILFSLFLIIGTPISFYLGKQGQLQEHLSILKAHNLVNEEQLIIPSEAQLSLSYEQGENITSGFIYLIQYHNIDSLKEVLSDEVYNSLLDSKEDSVYRLKNLYLEQLNIVVSYKESDDISKTELFYYLNPKVADFSPFKLDIESIVSFNCDDCELNETEDGWELKTEDDTYIITEDQMTLLQNTLRFNEGDNEKVIILENKFSESKLLLFELNTWDRENEALSTVSVTGWILK